MWLKQIDYNLPGIGENVSITRFYNSTIQESGIFGFGWKTDYDELIFRYVDTTTNFEYLTLRTGTGYGLYFFKDTNNQYISATPGFYGQMVRNSDETYTLTFKDGRIHKFHANGRLNWQKDRNGNQTTLTYSGGNDGTGNLTGITDSFNRTLNMGISAQTHEKYQLAF